MADLEFKPLTDGLGFHPFSNGLPYAPVGKSTARPTPSAAPAPQRSNPTPQQPIQPRMGAGAMSAGAPTFVTGPTFVAPTLRSPRIPTAAINPSLETRPTAKPVAEPAHGVGYVFRRMFAYAFDTMINTSVGAAALVVALRKLELPLDSLLGPGVILTTILFALVFNWTLIVAQEVAFNTTVGKRLFGLAIEGSPLALVGRAMLFLISVGFCAVGLVWSLFDPQRRCWHDMAVDIQPSEWTRL